MKRLIITILVLITLGAGGFLVLDSRKDKDSVLSSIFNQRPVPEQKPDEVKVKEPKFINQGTAPEFSGITKWLNTEKPIVMTEQQGKVVLINFWTYSSINCINSLPHINKWYEEYKDQGLSLIGVHTPEFAFEKVTSNIESAIKRYAITYPVALDNNYKTWSAYKNQFWPAVYLIDKNGEIVYTHYGEGKYEETELAIRKLLGLEGEFTPPPTPSESESFASQIHLGITRVSNFGGSETLSKDEQIYSFPKKLAKNKFALEGRWKFDSEAVSHTEGFGRIRLNFSASKVFMVAQSQEPTTIKIYVDGKLHKGVTITDSDLYSLYDSSVGANHTMEIEFPRGGVEVYTLTFN